MASEAEAASQSKSRIHRERNVHPEPFRLSEAELRKLDSSLKKNSTFIKRLRAFSDNNADALVKELRTLNLTKYVSEAVQAVVQAVLEGKVKPSDVPGLMAVCSALHQAYRDFAPDLVPALAKCFDVGAVVEEGIAAQKQQQQQQAAEKAAPAAGSAAAAVATAATPPAAPGATAVDKGLTRLKIVLRVLGELFVAGVYTDPAPLHRCVAQLSGSAKARAGGAVLVGLLGVATVFVKYFGVDLLGVRPTPADEGAEKPAPTGEPIVPPKVQQDLLRLLAEDFLKHVCDVLEHAFKDIAETRADNERMINSRGELTEDQRLLFEKKKKYLEKYHSTALTLATMLAQPNKIPPMPELTITPNANNQNIYFTSYSLAPQLAGDVSTEPLEPLPAFEDEDQRAFYEELPDLSPFIPEHVVAGRRGPQAGEAEDEEDDGAGGEREAEAAKGRKKPDAAAAAAAPKDERKAADAAAFEELLARLGKACTREAIDQLAVDFCLFCFAENTGPVPRSHKLYRNKLLKAIANVPRTMLELLPYHARLVASLNPYLKEMAPALVAKLEDDFQSQFASKNQMNIESKICNIRFIGEATKFRLCPEAAALRLLAKCLDDFAHHNIEVACALLDACGRFLLKQPCSHVRTSNLLQQMMRLRSIRTLDVRHETMVDSAFFGCVPRGKYKQFKEAKVLTPVQQYIRHVLNEELNRQSLKNVLRQLRKLDWDAPDTLLFLLKSMRRVCRTKFSSVHLIASLTAALATYYDAVAVKMVDAVLEDIRYGMETDTPSQPGSLPPQRRLLDLRFLGELFNYRVFDVDLVFEVLYQILFYAAYNDPPQETFRVRMVCTLLESTLPYFVVKSTGRRKLLRFLPYFYRFVLSKHKPFPVDLDFAFAELLEMVQSLLPSEDAKKPEVKFPDSLAVVNETIAGLEAELLWNHTLHQHASRAATFTVVYVYQLLHGPERGLQLANQIAQAPDKAAAVQAAREVAHALSPLSEDRPGAVWPVIRSTPVDGKEEAEEEGEDEEEDGGAEPGEGEARHRVGEAQDDRPEGPETDEGEESADERRPPASPSTGGRTAEAEEASPKLPKGRFLIPPALDPQTAGAAGKRDVDGETREFDDLMNAMVRESVAEAQGSAGAKRVLAGGPGKKLTNNLALPLTLYLTKMAAHEEARAMRVSEADEDEAPEDSEEEAPANAMQFAIVLKRKAEGKGEARRAAAAREATVDVKGTREVVLRRLPVPLDTRLAREKQKALEAQRKAQADNKRHVLEYERRSTGRPPNTMGNSHLYTRDHGQWYS